MAKDTIRILILEDTITDVDLLHLSLRKSGFDYISQVVDTKATFLQALKGFSPTIILSDHSLPNFDSIEAFRIYKENKLDIPFILVTGTVSEEFAVECIKSGVDDYVLKSNLQRLPSAIRGALQKRESERKQKISDERIARAQRIAKLGNWDWDLAKDQIEWSDEIFRILGLPADTTPLTQSTYRQYIHPEDRNQVQETLAHLLHDRQIYNLDYRIIRPDGEIRYVNEQADVQEDHYGNATRVTGTLLDITERKKIEHVLDHERKFLQAVLENIHVGILACDQHGAIILNNDALKSINNLPGNTGPAELWPNYYQLQDSDGKSHEQKMEFPLYKALRGERVVNSSYTVIPSNGIKKNVIVNAQPLFDQKGTILGAVSAVHDQTDLKNSEEKLRNKIKELDTFIYKASHDLKGPLSSMAGLLNLAKMEFQDKEVNLYFDKLEQCNHKLDVILQDLYEIAHITQGHSTMKPIDLNKLITDIISSLRNLPKCNTIHFENEIPPELQLISDEKLLRGILQNLIHNSIKYRRELSDSYIRIKAHQDINSVFIEVADNGIGIQEELKNKVFDMFFRGHYTSTGSGLGLYIAKNAAEKLNGHIELSSTYGKHTTFCLSLPKADVPELSGAKEQAYHS
jgi:PAS domain S-box-containing protein